MRVKLEPLRLANEISRASAIDGGHQRDFSMEANFSHTSRYVIRYLRPLHIARQASHD